MQWAVSKGSEESLQPLLRGGREQQESRKAGTSSVGPLGAIARTLAFMSAEIEGHW